MVKPAIRVRDLLALLSPDLAGNLRRLVEMLTPDTVDAMQSRAGSPDERKRLRLAVAMLRQADAMAAERQAERQAERDDKRQTRNSNARVRRRARRAALRAALDAPAEG